MKSFRKNPDGEENQKATRDNDRYIAALKLADAHKAKQTKHYHVNNGENDLCADCGEDLRHEIHFRVCKHKHKWKPLSSDALSSDVCSCGAERTIHGKIYEPTCDHNFVTKRQGGPPDMAESLEMVTYCEKCGYEPTD